MQLSRSELFEVVFEDADLLVINKPAGLVCHPTKGDQYSSLISRARLYVGAEGTVRMVNRLDRETSGVIIVAKSAPVAGELGKLLESRSVKKEYLAIVHGAMREDCGVIELPLGKDEQSQVAIKDCVRADGVTAKTEFEVRKRFTWEGQDFTLLHVSPHSGRKHQIRIHVAALGHPVVGDKLYGGDEDLYLALVQDRLTEEQKRRLILPNHALHACSIGFQWRGEWKQFQAPPDSVFARFAGDT